MSSRRNVREDIVLDKVRELRALIDVDGDSVECNVDAWYEVLQDLCNLPISDAVRQGYEDVLTTFPTAVAMWQRYISVEIAVKNTDAVKQIFGRSLLSCPSMELWTQYLKFVKSLNENGGVNGLVEVKGALEFTLEVLGQDITAGRVWQEYIAFLQTPKPGTDAFTAFFPDAQPGQEESARAVVLRRAYQRAIVVPTPFIDVLYRQYDAFENANNKILAKKVLEEWRPKYQAARQILRERKRKVELLTLMVLPMEPGRGGLLQSNQLSLWQEYIKYEKANPQRLEPITYISRVSLAYDQMLIVFAQYPEVWLEYAHWHSDGGGSGPALAVAVLARATRALPGCALLHFAMADIEEVQGRVEEAKQVYEGLVQLIETEVEASSTKLETDSATQPVHETLPLDQGALAWVQYMRFLRRTGDALGSRQLFLRARKWCLAPHHSRAPWQIFAAAALLEWQVGHESEVAAKIFEKGLDEPRIVKEPEYILQYQRFLCDIGDTDNARALFDRVFSETENLKSSLLWQRFVQFEYELGNIAAAHQVEQRARQALGEMAADTVQLALLKYQFQGSWPCSPLQRRHLEKTLNLAPSSLPSAVLFAQAAEPLLLGYSLDPPEDLRKSEGPLATLLEELPAPQSLEGAVVPPDTVIDALLAYDLSAPSVSRACFDLEAGRHPLDLRLGILKRRDEYLNGEGSYPVEAAEPNWYRGEEDYGAGYGVAQGPSGYNGYGDQYSSRQYAYEQGYSSHDYYADRYGDGQYGEAPGAYWEGAEAAAGYQEGPAIYQGYPDGAEGLGDRKRYGAWAYRGPRKER